MKTRERLSLGTDKRRGDRLEVGGTISQIIDHGSASAKINLYQLIAMTSLFALRASSSLRAGVDWRRLSVLRGISDDLLVSTSSGHQIGGDSHSALVDSLVRTNVVAAGSRLEAVFRRVDRGDFVMPAFRDSSDRYANRPLQIGTVATISTPQQHAQVLGLLEPHLQPGMTAVDVGSGSGILVAAMVHLVGPSGQVTGVDIVPELVAFSKDNLQRSLGKEVADKQTKILLSTGKTDLGLPSHHQYNCIHVGVAVETKAEAERFLEYLKPGGALLIPLGGADAEQKLVKVRSTQVGGMEK